MMYEQPNHVDVLRVIACILGSMIVAVTTTALAWLFIGPSPGPEMDALMQHRYHWRWDVADLFGATAAAMFTLAMAGLLSARKT